jgi:hypothetical protein
MLEQPALWLSPLLDGLRAGSGAALVRTVHDGPTRAPLGRVRFAARSWWAAWRSAELFVVEEGADAALLCSARRAPWWDGRTWVLDADRNPVARLRGSDLWVAKESVRLTAPAAVGAAAGRVWLNGAVAASWEPAGGGVLLQFLPPTSGRPFLRMAALAVALLH